MGSNIEPERNIPAAQAFIAADHDFLAAAPLVRTEPIGRADQPPYRNGALLVRTNLSRTRFAAYLKDVERRLGRVRTHDRYAARTIDLDVVVWNGCVVDADVHTRPFLREAVRVLCPAALARAHEGWERPAPNPRNGVPDESTEVR